MRYVAKIHVLDVMDKIVVSGYVLDTDVLVNPDHEVWEFSYETRGYGWDTEVDWLVSALYGALLDMSKASPRKRGEAEPMGVPHTLSETGDTA